MRKPTYRWDHWHRLRAANQAKRDTSSRLRRTLRIHRPDVEVWNGEEVLSARVRRKPMAVPAVLCFDRNPKETLSLLEKLRRRMLTASARRGAKWIRGEENGRPAVSTYLDFTTIEFISTATALVIAAEYDRAKILTGKPTPVFDLSRWKPAVFERLLQLGFFPTVGLGQIEQGDHATVNEDVMTLRFVSGSDAAETGRADKMLLELARFASGGRELPDEIAVPMNSALSEAMVNVRMHAYPEDLRFQFRHVRRWWLTGSADRANRVLSIAIYDQGATIPLTFARLPRPQAVMKFIKDGLAAVPGLGSPYSSDAVHIEAAMRYGNSTTGLPNQGKGLPQMIEAINATMATGGNGQLLVLSRGGRYLYKDGKVVERSHHDNSIGGTLIEWTIKLPATAEAV